MQFDFIPNWLRFFTSTNFKLPEKLKKITEIDTIIEAIAMSNGFNNQLTTSTSNSYSLFHTMDANSLWMPTVWRNLVCLRIDFNNL